MWIMHEVDGPHARRQHGETTAEPTDTSTSQCSGSGLWKAAREASPKHSMEQAARRIRRGPAQEGSPVHSKALSSEGTPFCEMIAATLRKFSMRVKVEPEDEKVRCGQP